MADITINIENRATVVQSVITPSIEVFFPGKKGDPGAPGSMVVAVSDIDGQFSGIPVDRILGEVLNYGDFVYFKGADGKAWKGNYRSAAAMPVVGAVVIGGGVDEVGTILVFGSITKTSWAWTPGGILYASINGTLTQVPISGTGNYGQVVGLAMTGDTVFINPAYVLVEAA
jgi:hypothetical protein